MRVGVLTLKDVLPGGRGGGKVCPENKVLHNANLTHIYCNGTKESAAFMTSNDMIFTGVEQVVAQPLVFKHKLAIGDEAFASMRLKKHLGQMWDVLGAAGTAGAAAKSSVVANALFAKGGIAALVGGATTPLGWVIAASVVGGGAWFALTKVFRAETDKRVEVIPKFINTPLDILAIRLFELMVPMALKMAAAGGEVSDNQRYLISQHLQQQWGYDQAFVEHAASVLEEALDNLDVAQLAQQLAFYQKQNPDCNDRAMRDELFAFLRQVGARDQALNAAQESLLIEIETIFAEVEGDTLLNKGLESLKQAAQSVGGTAGQTASEVTSQVTRVAEQAAGNAAELGADIGKRVLSLLNKGKPF